MTFPCACQCFLTLVLLFMAASPLQTHARESKFFSKVSRTEPETPKTETESIFPSPTASPAAAESTTTEQGYGLFGKEEETYQYSPTTTNPTKSEPRKFKYVQPNGVKQSNYGGAGERHGMSDTRFLENGRYFYDVNSEKEVVANNGKLKEDEEGHESYYSYDNGNQYKEERYETGEEQGMSDTRFLENGRYYYGIQAEKKKNNNNGYSNNVEFYNSKNYEDEEEEEEEEDKYGNQLYGTGEKQGMSDTRFLEKGRYFYDVKGERNGKNNQEDPNGVEFYNNENNNNDNNNNNNNEYYQKESYEPEKSSYQGESYETENEKYNGGKGNVYEGKFGKGYDFRSTPNKFPSYEFDSIEEYEKYEQGRSHQEEYVP